ncbi:PGPGW domain-containing protein [Gordonia shandongensis]|uniref:PGPGW domain-containing protein n=1 Tax=Gordonia shandongensis TaxID=376351 RepID=UPI000421B063|nr:PGPGW domain-containing protein [Gordonia shandongensis]
MRLRIKVWHRQRRYAIRQRPVLNRLYRVGVGIIGTLLVLAGMAMIPLPIPGPGWVTFFLGLAALSTEFAWAHSVTSFMHRQLRRAGALTAAAVHQWRTWSRGYLDRHSGIAYLQSWLDHQRSYQFSYAFALAH